MANWLLTTRPDITPGSAQLFRGLGHITSNHQAVAEHILGYVHAHPDLGITFKLLQPLGAEHQPSRSRPTNKARTVTVLRVHVSSKTKPKPFHHENAPLRDFAVLFGKVAFIWALVHVCPSTKPCFFANKGYTRE